MVAGSEKSQSQTGALSMIASLQSNAFRCALLSVSRREQETGQVR
jgi:hypothetical protein